MWRLTEFVRARQSRRELVVSGPGPHMSRARPAGGAKSLSRKSLSRKSLGNRQSNRQVEIRAVSHATRHTNNPAMSAE